MWTWGCVHTVKYNSIKLYFYIFELEEYFIWINISKEIWSNIFESQTSRSLNPFLRLPDNFLKLFDQKASFAIWSNIFELSGSKWYDAHVLNTVPWKYSSKLKIQPTNKN